MSKLSGAERAAVFLMSLGDNAAASILRHMGPREMQQVTQAMANLRKVSWDDVSEVVNSFRNEFRDETAFGIKAPEFTRKVLKSTLGDNQADALLERVKPRNQPPQLESLQWMDPIELAAILKDEHPQVIATVLVLLSPESSADLIERLDEGVARQTIARLASLSSVSTAAIREIEELLRAHGIAGVQQRSSPIELKGAKQAADIINAIQSDLDEKLIEALREASEDLAQEVEDMMFAFEGLKELDDRGLQTLMREINGDLLVPALKGADKALQERFFGAMSRRAAEMLRDDLEVAGPIRVADVEAAHKEILAVARRLADEGRIALGGKGGDEYV